MLGRLDYFLLAEAYRARTRAQSQCSSLQLLLRGGRGRWTLGIALGPPRRSEVSRSFYHVWARPVARSAQEQDPSLRSPHVGEWQRPERGGAWAELPGGAGPPPPTGVRVLSPALGRGCWRCDLLDFLFPGLHSEGSSPFPS